MSAVGNKSGQAICVPRCGIPAITSSHTDEDKREKAPSKYTMDSPDGPLLSTLTFDTDTWQTLTKPLDKRIKGKHDIYFVFGNGKFLFDEWKFTNNESVGRICQYLFTLVMISLHKFEPTHNKPASYFASVLPPYWQSFAMPLAKPCQLVGKKDKSNIAVRKEAEARPQYNSANGKETD